MFGKTIRRAVKRMRKRQYHNFLNKDSLLVHYYMDIYITIHDDGIHLLK